VSQPWSDTTKRSVVIALALIGALALLQLRALIPPVAVAGIISYALFPLVDSLQARTRLPRSLAVLMVDLLALVVVAIIPAVAAPTLMAQIRQIDVDFDGLADEVLMRVTQVLSDASGGSIDATGMLESAGTSLTELLSPLITGSVFLLLDLASILLWVVFAFAVSFYLMRDWHRITGYLHTVVPPGYREDYAQITAEIGRIWQAFFRGQVLLSLVVGVAVAILMRLVGVRNALVLGLLAGLLEVVPNVGPVVAAIPAVTLALFQGSTWLPIPPFWFAVLVAGIYTAVQQVENNYLVPRIIGGSVRLHPLVVLVGAISGARMAGVLGIFMAAPVLASARVLLSFIYAKLLDVEPAVKRSAGLTEGPQDGASPRAWRNTLVVTWRRVITVTRRRPEG